MHYVDFKKYIKQHSERPLDIKFFKPYIPKFRIGELVQVCDPDDDEWENARILKFDDYKKTYTVQFMDDNEEEKGIKEKEIKPINDENGNDMEEEEKKK